MGKDGGGGGSYSTSVSCSCSCSGKTTKENAFLATITVINREMERLHSALRGADGDESTIQDQLGELQQELIRLSQAISEG